MRLSFLSVDHLAHLLCYLCFHYLLWQLLLKLLDIDYADVGVRFTSRGSCLGKVGQNIAKRECDPKCRDQKRGVSSLCSRHYSYDRQWLSFLASYDFVIAILCTLPLPT